MAISQLSAEAWSDAVVSLARVADVLVDGGLLMHYLRCFAALFIFLRRMRFWRSSCVTRVCFWLRHRQPDSERHGPCFGEVGNSLRLQLNP